MLDIFLTLENVGTLNPRACACQMYVKIALYLVWRPLRSRILFPWPLRTIREVAKLVQSYILEIWCRTCLLIYCT